MSECTSSTGHFNGHGDALVQYEAHGPMQHVQGYTGSHWTLPLGNYSFCIAPEAARATANEQGQKHTPTLLAILMAMAIHCYITMHIARWRRSRAPLEATGLHHLVSIMSDNIKETYLHQFFLMVSIVNTLKMDPKQKDDPN